MDAASSSTTAQQKYDVFLSFRGEDTRHSFTSHLYAALCQKKINTFIDDDGLKIGDPISPSLLNAIQQSKISIIIFSKGYASSRWCLEELVKILECMHKYGQIVMPVFYNIDPSDVRNQTGTFEKAFEKHEERFKDNPEMLLRWRTALTKSANLSGFDSNVIRLESKLVWEVVKVVLIKLNGDSPLIDEDLVGIDSRIKDIEELLCIGFGGVRKIGIWGPGGIGKTTLAKAVYNKISKKRHFENSYFFNIKEELEKSKGLTGLQQQIIRAILSDEGADIGSLSTRSRLGRVKVLIVLDDVTDFEQIEKLNKHFQLLDPKSRIIMTTRDKHILEQCRVDENDIYETKILYDDAALELFSRHAFGQKYPPEDFRQLVERVLLYANGFPLALIVLGRFLCRRTNKAWESALENLMMNDHKGIYNVLKLSYDGLIDNERAVFLDIACFFEGYERDLIEATLNARNFNSYIYIEVLIERCLITISDNTITMHDLLQEMGREIVRQESIDDPSKRSRLWNHEDILKVLTKNKGTEVIRSIRLDRSKVSELHINLEAFNNMQNLKFLEVYGFQHDEMVPSWGVHEPNSSFLRLDIFKPCFEWLWKFFEKNSSKHEKKLIGFERLQSDFSELRYLCWPRYSAESLPPKFNPKNLVVLDMRFSNLKQLWIGDQRQNLLNLKHIDLSYSKHLCRMPNRLIAPNLESLILEGCTNLRECFSSMHNLDKLVLLNLQGCKNLDMLSISPQCRDLREVILSDCSSLKTVSYIPSAVEKLYLDETAIEELPSLEHLSRLVRLSLENCLALKSLPESIRGCRSLEYLSLSYSSKLDRLPEGLGNLIALKTLRLKGISVREVPQSIACLTNLETFFLVRCRLEKPMTLLGCGFSVLNKLGYLDLSDSCIKELPSSLGQLCNLKMLYLRGNNFESLPTFEGLSKLDWLNISNCQRLKYLPKLPDKLPNFDATGCVSLEVISNLPAPFLSGGFPVRQISFLNCSKLKFHEHPALKEALLLMERIAYVAYHFEMVREINTTWPRSSISYPGSEIPEQFNFISGEDFVKLPTDWFNDKFIGFVMCFVVSFPHTLRESMSVSVEYRLVVNEEIIFRSGFPSFQVDTGIVSDHVFLQDYYYDSVLWPIKFYTLRQLSSNLEGRIEFDVATTTNILRSERVTNVCKVKKCGVKLLYGKGNGLRRDAIVKRDQGNCFDGDCWQCLLTSSDEHHYDGTDPARSLRALLVSRGLYRRAWELMAKSSLDLADFTRDTCGSLKRAIEEEKERGGSQS